MVLKNEEMISLRIIENNSEKGRVNIFLLGKILFMYVGFYSFQLKEETNRDYSFPAGLEDHILGENVSPNMNIAGLVPSELTQSNTSLGSSSSSGDAGKLQYSTGRRDGPFLSFMCPYLYLHLPHYTIDPLC